MSGVFVYGGLDRNIPPWVDREAHGAHHSSVTGQQSRSSSVKGQSPAQGGYVCGGTDRTRVDWQLELVDKD